MEIVVEFSNDEIKDILKDQAERYTYIPTEMEVVDVSVLVGDGYVQVITRTQKKEEGENNATK